MKQRILTSAIGVVIFFCVLFAPNVVFSAAVLLITCIAAYEIHHAVGANQFLTVAGIVSAAVVFTGTVTDNLILSIVITFGVYMLLSIVLFGKCKVQTIYMLGFSSVVFSVSLSTLAVIKNNFGIAGALLPFVFAWITDTGAYFCGITMGKHKLVSHLSPKKTVEGSLGGMAACVIVSVFYNWLLLNYFDITLAARGSAAVMAVISLIASVIAQFGDLTLSAIKREFGVKDYGNILPGHGGVLDRFDSLIFVAPFVYAALMFLN